MKKEYVKAEIEIIRIDFCDVITTSGDGSSAPGEKPGNVFEGGFDPNGWT